MAKNPNKKKLIALTGATGFVGGHILDEALRQGHQVRALTRRPQALREGVEWVPGDLHNDRALATLVEDAGALIHCAGIVKARRVADFHEINTQSLTRLLDLLHQRKGGNDGSQVIFISSLTARHPHLSPYARSKYNAEEILKSRGAAFPWTIVRPPAVYGPGDMEILKLFRAMKRGYAPVAGSADNTFSLIHGRDLATATLATLGLEKSCAITLEPDDKKENGYTVTQVAKLAAKEFGRPVKPLPIPLAVLYTVAFFNELAAAITGRAPIFSRPKVREMSYPNWVSDHKTHALVPHWSPKFGLEAGLKDTIAWYRRHGHL